MHHVTALTLVVASSAALGACHSTASCEGGCVIGGVCHAAGDSVLGNSCSVCDPLRAATAWSDACSQAGPLMTCDETAQVCVCPGCFVDGWCWAAGAKKPDDSCRVCDPTTSAAGWTTAADGLPCDDGLFCTVGGACFAGYCASMPRDCSACGAPATCDEAARSCGPTSAECAAGCAAAAQNDSLVTSAEGTNLLALSADDAWVMLGFGERGAAWLVRLADGREFPFVSAMGDGNNPASPPVVAPAGAAFLMHDGTAAILLWQPTWVTKVAAGADKIIPEQGGFSPDGRYVLHTNRFGTSHWDHPSVFDTQTGVDTLTDNASLSRLFFSPDSSVLVGWNYDAVYYPCAELWWRPSSGSVSSTLARTARPGQVTGDSAGVVFTDSCDATADAFTLFYATFANPSQRVTISSAAAAFSTSPVGSRVVFIEKGAAGDLVLQSMVLSTGATTTLTLAGQLHGLIGWDPPGTLLLVSSTAGVGAVPVDGGLPFSLSGTAPPCDGAYLCSYAVRWSPDGRYVAFVGDLGPTVGHITDSVLTTNVVPSGWQIDRFVDHRLVAFEPGTDPTVGALWLYDAATDASTLIHPSVRRFHVGSTRVAYQTVGCGPDGVFVHDIGAP